MGHCSRVQAWGLGLHQEHCRPICAMFWCMWDCLKGQCHEIFRFFLQTIPSRSLIHALKCFRILLRIRREINENVLSRAMRHSAGLFSRICMKTNMCGPALCGIALDHGPALCRIAQNHASAMLHSAGPWPCAMSHCAGQNFIALEKFVKLSTCAVGLKGTIYQKIVHMWFSLHYTYEIRF
jgi:hypothetical protein